MYKTTIRKIIYIQYFFVFFLLFYFIQDTNTRSLSVRLIHMSLTYFLLYFWVKKCWLKKKKKTIKKLYCCFTNVKHSITYNTYQPQQSICRKKKFFTHTHTHTNTKRKPRIKGILTFMLYVEQNPTPLDGTCELTDKQTDRLCGRQMDGQTDRDIHRKINTSSYI